MDNKLWIMGLVFLIVGSVSGMAVCIDNDAPSAPGNLRVSGNAGSILLQWSEAVDSPDCSGIDYYNISRDGNWIGSVDGLTFIDNASLKEGEYSYTVHAVDLVGGNAGASIKNVIQVSSGGGSSGGGSSGGGGRSSYVCEVDWSCGEWSECVDGASSRTCKDLNKCGTTYLKPDEVLECGLSESFEVDDVEPEVESEDFFSAMTGAVVGVAGTTGGAVTGAFVLMMLFGFIAIRIKRKG